MNTKKLLIFLGLILLISTISAERYVNYDFKEGFILADGSKQETNTPLNDVNVIGFICANTDCSSVSGTLWGGSVLNSGDDKIQLAYPTTLQSPYGYGIYYFKEGYLTRETSANWWGTVSSDPQGPITHHLKKKEACHAPIDSFTVVNEAQPNIPLVINMNVALDATTHAAIQNAGPLNYIPSQLTEYYSVKTKVYLKIYDFNGDLVEEQSKNLIIPFGESKEVDFTWVPSKIGNHTITVSTKVNDDKCSSSIDESTSKNVFVLSEKPRNMYYTILNDLMTNNPFPTQGDLIKITATRISNFANNNYELSPVPTNVELTITRQADDFVVVEETLNLDANPDEFNPIEFEYDWNTTLQSGWYEISLTGNPLATMGDFQSISDTISETIFLADNQEIAPSVKITANPISGKAPLKIEFSSTVSGGIKPYTFSWDFGDGTTGTEKNINHTYTTPGSYTAKLTVTDADEDQGIDTTTIIVEKSLSFCTDEDGDGFNTESQLCGPVDCNDNNFEINPDATEICNDGIDNNCDGLTDFEDLVCIFTPTCGDGILTLGLEECDDGNSVNEDSCRNNCTLPYCGDGIIDNNEECDDGNNVNSDKCSNTCEIKNDNKKKSSSSKTRYTEEFCLSNWECSEWSDCFNKVQTRNCKDSNHCELEYNRPSEQTICEITAAATLKKENKNGIYFLLAGLLIGSLLLIVLILIKK